MRVLVPLDGSRLADAVVSHVVALVQRGRGECDVFLLTAIGDAPEAHAEARAHLVDVERLLRDEGFRVRHDVVRADPARAIVEHAAGHAVDLVAMATHGRSGLSRWVRGSVAEEVVRGCSATVLLVNPRGLTLAGDALRYRRVLLPIDAATVVDDAARPVGALAGVAGASVDLLAVGAVARPLVDDARRALAAAGVGVEVVPVRAADPAEEILRVARERGADLIVLCTGPRSWASRWPIGLATEQVMRSAPCAVLLLRDAGSIVGGAPERTAAAPR